MSLKTISIFSFSVGANIQGPESVINMIESSTFLNEYIPGFRFGKNESKNIRIEINSAYKENITLFESEDAAVIHFRNEYTDKDIISLIELVLEYYRQKRGIFTIHGSACDYKGSGILIIGGASGIGKSTLAYKLSEKTSDFEFIGDEKICVNNRGEIIGGIQKVGINQKINTGNSDKSISLWYGTASKISTIIQPILCDDGKLDVFEWNEASKKWHLYEEFSRKIRAVSRMAAGIPIQSIDSDKIAIKRLNFIDYLVLNNSIKAFTIQGDIVEVINYLQNKVKGHSDAQIC